MKRIFFIVSAILVLIAANGCNAAGASAGAPAVVQFGSMQLQINEILVGYNVPVACEDNQPVCDSARPGYKVFSLIFEPVDLPAGEHIPYEQLPVEVTIDTDASESVPVTWRSYNKETRRMILSFEVPEAASQYTLRVTGNEDLVLTPPSK